MLFKRIVLIMILLLISPSATTYAMSGASMEIDQPYEHTEEELKMISYKRKVARQESLIKTRSYVDGEYMTLQVPVYEQEKNYYCGPATVKQVTQFVTGSSHSQDYIAKVMGTSSEGTTMAYMTKYLNDVKGLGYVYDTGITDSYSVWLDAIFSSIRNSKPAIIIVSDPRGNVLPYKTTAHFVNSSGIDTKYSSNKLRITDPWTPGLGNKWYYSSDIYTLNHNDVFTWRRALIW